MTQQWEMITLYRESGDCYRPIEREDTLTVQKQCDNVSPIAYTDACRIERHVAYNASVISS